MQDQKIIELLRSNKNDQALLALYRNFPSIRKLIRSKGGHSADAEDIFQEALIILCRKVSQPEFVLHARLSTYLYSVCRFLWKDELKKRKNHLLSDFDTGLTQQEEMQLAGDIEHTARLKMAEKVIDELGERCREILLLFYSAGLNFKVIAAKMGYNSENTARNQKYKCLEAARNRLKELKNISRII